MRKFRTKSVAGGYAFAGLLAVAAMNGCDQQTIYRTSSGLTYRVWHRQPHGPVAGSGATFKVRYRELHADTPYDGTGGRMPLYQPLMPGLVFPYTVGEALGGARAGDSIVYTRRVDQLMARGILKKLPPGWKSSDVLKGTILVEKVFPFDPVHGDSILQADKLAEARRLLDTARALGERHMKAWFASRGIAAEAKAGGVYRVIDGVGKGAVVDSGMTALLTYRISTLPGKLVKSNLDTSFHQPSPLPVRIGSGMLPPLIDRALRGLRKGSRVRIFVLAGADVSPATVLRMGGVDPEGTVWELELE